MKTFEVLLDGKLESHEARKDIADRFLSFVEEFRMIKLHVDLQSDTRLVISESAGSQETKTKSSFSIDVSIQGIASDQSSTKVIITLDVYCICNEGLGKVRKVENQVSSFYSKFQSVFDLPAITRENL